MRKPAANRTVDPLSDALASFAPELPLAVAFSGGADSSALLAACAEKWPGKVGAIHVHHGLQAAADGFALHCRAICDRLGLPLIVRHVDGRNAPGQSPEDAARDARYTALVSAAVDTSTGEPFRSIAIAQHADDQIETMLLALSRGAGLPGLAAMPARWVRAGMTFHRPLLGVPAPQIRAWLAQRRISFIEDPTNTDQGLTRNRIRARLLPALQDTFPQFRVTFARSARHAAQAQQLLVELAAADLALASRQHDGALLLAAAQALSPARQVNLVRHWLKSRHGVAPNNAQLDELLQQIADCVTRGHRIHIKVANGFVERRGEVLAWYNATPDPTLPDRR